MKILVLFVHIFHLLLDLTAVAEEVALLRGGCLAEKLANVQTLRILGHVPTEECYVQSL